MPRTSGSASTYQLKFSKESPDSGLVNRIKNLKQENTILNEDDNQTECDDGYGKDEPYGRLSYKTDLVHSKQEMQIMRGTLDIP